MPNSSFPLSATEAQRTSERLQVPSEKLRWQQRAMREAAEAMQAALERTWQHTLELRTLLDTCRSEIAEAKAVSANHRDPVRRLITSETTR